MERFAKIIFILSLPVFVWAQPQQIQLDTLQLALKNAANDTVRMDAYSRIAGYYSEINRDSALLYYAQGLSIAQKLKVRLMEVSILQGRGFIFTNIGNYPEALESLYQALKIAEAPASEKSIRNLPAGQSPRNARLNLIGYNHLNMGHLYGATGNNYKKISEYLIAIEFADSVQNGGLKITATMNLGNAYLKLNKLDSALLFEQRAISMILNRPGGYERYDGFAFELLGRIYQSKGDFELSRDAFQKSIRIAKEQNNLSGLPRALNFVGEFYKTIKKPDSSLQYAREALEIAKIVGLPLEMKNAYKLLSGIYSDQKNKDSTLAYLKLYTILNDSLNKVEKQNLLAYQNIGFEEQIRVKKLEEEKILSQIKTRTYTMLAGLGVFLAISLILYRNNRQKQKTNKVLETTLTNLKSTQALLIQSEKMASLGELTAGIAHEIQNPLNFVNNFSEVNGDLIKELKNELINNNLEEIKSIANDIESNSEKINHHGKRAESIVRGMLQHSRKSTGTKDPTDINALADEYMRLSYHGLRAKDKSFNAAIKMDLDPTMPLVNVIPQDIGRVLLNLFNNAFWAVAEKSKNPNLSPQPLKGSYEPLVKVSTRFISSPLGVGGNNESNKTIEISISDNGSGIPASIKEKIFQPFFTTKPTGQGTGLGLSLAYDIIKAHSGIINMNSNKEGSTFQILLPIQ